MCDHLMCRYTIYLQIFCLFMLFWLVNFVIALGQMTLAGAFASYYWAFDKSKDIPTFPLLSSLGRCLRWGLSQRESVSSSSLSCHTHVFYIIHTFERCIYVLLFQQQHKTDLSIWAFSKFNNTLYFIVIQASTPSPEIIAYTQCLKHPSRTLQTTHTLRCLNLWCKMFAVNRLSVFS